MDLVFVVVRLVGYVIRVLTWIIVIDAILTWFPQIDRRHPIVVTLRKITEPIYRPIRRLIPPQRTGYIDLSPLIAIVLLQVLWMIVVSLAFRS